MIHLDKRQRSPFVMTHLTTEIKLHENIKLNFFTMVELDGTGQYGTMFSFRCADTICRPDERVNSFLLLIRFLRGGEFLILEVTDVDVGQVLWWCGLE